MMCKGEEGVGIQILLSISILIALDEQISP